ncbi:MAG TPA: diphthine--ammonia ligase [Ktedonobacterales bacterium]|nr:diphthine--ammonia ligase [Ktedonobacterales bacterium]
MSSGHATCAVFFSGGKDSMLALDRSLRRGLPVTRLITLYDEASQRVRFHGTPITVMRAQAQALGLPIALYPTTPATFERVLLGALADLRREGIATLIFGDIHLADVRAWYEDRVRAAGFDHLEPLWGEDPATLANEVVERGYEAVITCIEDATAKPEWLGQTLSQPLLQSFAATGIDVCGERGEYHTFVVDGPLFTSRVPITTGTVHSEGGFRQLDMALASSAPEAVSDGQAT